jgi:hypothetical protein
MSRTALGLAGVAIGIGIGVTACGGSGAAGHDVGPKDGVDSGAPADNDGSTTGSDSGGQTNEAGQTQMDTGSSSSGTFPAPFPAPPQVVNGGGGVLATPQIVAIFFMDDDPTSIATYTQFYKGLGGTQYWQALSEYGIGKATVSVVTLPQTAPTTIDDSFTQAGNSDLQNWLLGVIGTNGIPAAGPNVVYMINYPTQTTVTQDGASAGGGNCDAFGGYHAGLQDNQGNNLAYGVVPRCPAVPGATADQTFTSSASHEVVESATDPYNSPAWLEADDAHMFWDEANGGSEIGDMCENDPEAYYQFPDFPFVVQRFWSNASAKAGHDPCVPEIAGQTFFAAVPEVSDTMITFPNDFGNPVMAAGTKIAVGASSTINLDLYSDKATSPWQVQVQDLNDFAGGGSPLLTLSLGKSTGNNGDKIPLTIKVNAAGNATGNNQGNGEALNTEVYVIVVTQGNLQHFWFGAVGN